MLSIFILFNFGAITSSLKIIFKVVTAVAQSMNIKKNQGSKLLKIRSISIK